MDIVRQATVTLAVLLVVRTFGNAAEPPTPRKAPQDVASEVDWNEGRGVSGSAGGVNWEIDDEPFGRIVKGGSLYIYHEATNEDLKNVLSDPDLQPLFKAHRIVCIKLEGLAHLTDVSSTRLRKIPDLTELWLEADTIHVTDPGFARLDGMDWLQSLAVEGDILTDADLKHLAPLTRLRVLDLVRCVKLTGKGLASLKNARQLESLALPGSKLSDDGLDNLKQWPNLLELSLGGLWDVSEWMAPHSFAPPTPAWFWEREGKGPNIDRGMHVLEHLTNLRRLELSGIKITDEGLKAACSLARLETLRLSDLKVSAAGFTNLGSLKALRSFVVRRTPTPADGLSRLKALPQLEEISFEDTDLADGSAQQLGGLVNLKRLCITHQDQTGAHADDVHLQLRGAGLAAVLKTMPVLTDLDLTYSRDLDDSVMPGIAAIPSLKRLVLSGTGVDDKGLQQIAGLKNLEELDISCPHVEYSLDARSDRYLIGDEGMRCLKGLASLRKLNLNRTGVTDNGLAELRGLKNLRELNISQTGVTDKGLQELQGLIELRRLSLPEGITDKGVEHLASLISLEDLGSDSLPSGVTAKGLAFLHDHCPNLRFVETERGDSIEDGVLHLINP